MTLDDQDGCWVSLLNPTYRKLIWPKTTFTTSPASFFKREKMQAYGLVQLRSGVLHVLVFGYRQVGFGTRQGRMYLKNNDRFFFNRDNPVS
jgi:hypothetical protein